MTPVITVMGHVDHGKTSLLDKIRSTNVASGEAGGITQSVRAHQVIFENATGKHKLTFIDTPGHEAFSNMRSRGARVGNVAVIVVAVNEGAKPQTIEAIKFALEEKIPIIICLTKIDMPAEPENKIFSQLAAGGLLVEEMGGEAVVVRVSSKTGEGIDKLLETILLLNEMHPLNEGELGNGELAEGLVLESHLDKNMGPVALGIIKNGRLTSENNIFAANDEFSSKLRDLLDVDFKPIKSLEGGDPIWMVGLEKVLNVGQVVRFFADEKKALAEVEAIKEEEEYNKTLNQDPVAAFAAMFSKNSVSVAGDSNKKTLNIILRTDSRGSMEVARHEIEKLADEFAEVRIKDTKEGEITEADIKHAKDMNAIIIGFRSKVTDGTMKLAMHEKVLVRNYEIIYEMIEELEGALLGLITPEEEEVEVARAQVKKAFVLTNGQYVAGSVILKGKMIKGYRVFIERNGEEIGRGKVNEIRILKNEVKEADKGKECGILIEPNLEIHDGDFVVAYKLEKI